MSFVDAFKFYPSNGWGTGWDGRIPIVEWGNSSLAAGCMGFCRSLKSKQF